MVRSKLSPLTFYTYYLLIVKYVDFIYKYIYVLELLYITIYDDKWWIII